MASEKTSETCDEIETILDKALDIGWQLMLETETENLIVVVTGERQKHCPGVNISFHDNDTCIFRTTYYVSDSVDIALMRNFTNSLKLFIDNYK